MLSLLQKELKVAMKAQNKATLIGLRNILGALKAQQIDKGENLTKQECLQILQSLAKKSKDSISQYNKGGRDDLAEVEEFELQLIEKYLPEQLSEDDVRASVRNTIKAIKAESIKDMGRVMGASMKELGGVVDGQMVHKIVQEELSS